MQCKTILLDRISSFKLISFDKRSTLLWRIYEWPQGGGVRRNIWKGIHSVIELALFFVFSFKLKNRSLIIQQQQQHPSARHRLFSHFPQNRRSSPRGGEGDRGGEGGGGRGQKPNLDTCYLNFREGEKKAREREKDSFGSCWAWFLNLIRHSD